MVSLSDDELSVIFSSVSSPSDRSSLSLVSKQWLRVEGLTRESLLSLSPHLLPSFLPRFPGILSFLSPQPLPDPLALSLASLSPRLHTLLLNSPLPSDHQSPNSDDITDVGLYAIAKWCNNLKTLSLQNRRNIGDIGVFSLVRFSCRLTSLDLSGCVALTDQALLAVGLMGAIESLSLNRCNLITDKGLAMLSFEPLSRKLKRLEISGCDKITDLGVVSLSKMAALEELAVADCGAGITELGGLSISRIGSLRRLDVSRLEVADLTVAMVAEGCKELVEVCLNGCRNVSGSGVAGAFVGHKRVEVIGMAGCEGVEVECVRRLVYECESLKCVGLDRGVKAKFPVEVLRDLAAVCRLDWM